MEFAGDTLYVSDLDGTLLGEPPELPEGAAALLNEMLDAGLPFTVATARSWASAGPIVRALHLKYPVVAYNGAFLVDPTTGKDIDRCLFDEVTATNASGDRTLTGPCNKDELILVDRCQEDNAVFLLCLDVGSDVLQRLRIDALHAFDQDLSVAQRTQLMYEIICLQREDLLLELRACLVGRI